MEAYRRIEDLIVYQKLCRLHIEICEHTHQWPAEEKYELGSQTRRSSNSAPAQLAEKYDDRHVRNKIEGVNRSRGEAAETVHHVYMAHLSSYQISIKLNTRRTTIRRFTSCLIPRES
jgi:four helix bundle protein